MNPMIPPMQPFCLKTPTFPRERYNCFVMINFEIESSIRLSNNYHVAIQFQKR